MDYFFNQGLATSGCLRRNLLPGINGVDLRLTGGAFGPACGVLDPIAELPVALGHQTNDFVDTACPVSEARASGVNQLANEIFVAHEVASCD
jgi:hypothetical protein